MVRLRTSLIGVLLFLVLALIKDVLPVRTPTQKTYRPPPRVHPCEHSSCYPATGNLLIGRENRLTASSTCGINNPERFCIVSHLEEKKCFLCDTRTQTESDTLKNHRIGQIISKNRPGTREQSWWQSENGKENVTIQLDLEAEFHFTHLIIVFATFRPAAMFIERSYDFGKTWHVYKYFAHQCHDSFPGVSLVAKNITDVVCDHRYSGVEPSKNGEVIFRVLPPNMHIENPYAEHVQNMLKMTNLRINFTRLHNLGDTLLDDRQEIQEKYYYAISNMIVRGSCSCYGHASRCLPLEGVLDKIDMVHGRCECTHNTKGLNCEECEDFFNDYPWKPALGKQTNACKKCNCNNHAQSCHFDKAVYDQSGLTSGGVCDNCEHNTQGQHCEECLPFFYKDPSEDIQSPYVCRLCDCDPDGSLDEGICDSITNEEGEAGACHCKVHVKGRRCETCKEGFWNLDPSNPEGCQTCTCNILGTINNSGCNMHTGECTCKRLVTGKDCNQCMPETYGLSDSRDGCSVCNCDPGGSFDNHCDVITGQCSCRTHMTGRTCSTPKQNHFIPDLRVTLEAEIPTVTECTSQTTNGQNNCSIVIGKPYDDGRTDWTGQGYTAVGEGSTISFKVDDVPKTMAYDVVIRYSTQERGDWEDALITVIRPEPYDPEGPCANSHPSLETDVELRLPQYHTSQVALYEVCLEQGKTYVFNIAFRHYRKNENNPAAQILIDSLTLLPRIEVTPIFTGGPPGKTRLDEFRRLGCNETLYRFNEKTDEQCKDLEKAISIYIFDGASPCNCNPTGSVTNQCDQYGGNCQCKQNVVGRQCDKCAPGTYGFGPEGCKACDCNSFGAQDNACDLVTGQCTCRPNAYGRECDQCQFGFWNFPHCEQCQCNGHTQNCDTHSGECISCQDFTTGYQCDQCITGYHGNPILGSEIGCRPCRCPDTLASNHSHADVCALDPRNNDMVCYCREGYSGARCDICDENFFGNPEVPGGSCQRCECSNNIDMSRGGNCDLKTGQCLQCLYETTGDHCEMCKDGFYGNALQQDCRECSCYLLGTNATVKYCNRATGQCPCLPNVVGTSCDSCIENHWKIASGLGCEYCGCDPVGSESEQCNAYDGQCQCKPGFGGVQCNQCEANYWGDPNMKCNACDCDHYGSDIEQCDRETGKCVCIEGIGGHKCNQCDRGFYGEAPHCSKCGECFDNWDLILNQVQEETNSVIDQAKQIKTVGTTGAYTKEFDAMEKKLGLIRNLLSNTSVSAQDISDLDNRVAELRKHYGQSLDQLQEFENSLEKVYSGTNLGNVALSELRNKTEQIKKFAVDLKENATQLQEANIEGALNLTRAAWEKVSVLANLDGETQEIGANAERHCRRTEAMVNRSMDEFSELDRKNGEDLSQYQEEIANLNGKIPDLNEQICDKRGDPCDNLCGGAGCKQCGGISCEKGALTKAEKALSYVKDTEKDIKTKDEIAEDLIRSLSQAKTNASDAFRKSEKVFQEAEAFLNNTKNSIAIGNELITNLTNVLNNNTASPNEIKNIAEKTLLLDLELDPEEIKTLATKIDGTVSELENVEAIIYETRNDLERVDMLKHQANSSKTQAEAVLESAKNVSKALEEADAAQTKAQHAITTASSDISLAHDDLAEIDSETGDAQSKASTTANKVSELNDKLNALQKNFLKNDLDAKSIKNEAELVRDSANNAHEDATKLKNVYRTANDSLTAKAVASEGARARAQQLLHRANKITGETKSRLDEIQGMVDVYKTHEKELDQLRGKVDNLNDQMSGYLATIQDNADRYRQCLS